MPPKRREQTDNMPELEELQAADDNQRRISVQGMVDCIEGQSHGQPVAKQPVMPHGHTPDKDVADLEETSKVMAEGILVYVKAVVSHITQSTNQRNFQHKEPKQGVGSSGAGETHRSIPTPPILEEMYTSPHRREETVFQRSPANVRGNGNGNPRPHLHQLCNVTNPVNQPDLCEEGMCFPVESTDINADNGAYEARGHDFTIIPSRTGTQVDLGQKMNSAIPVKAQSKAITAAAEVSVCQSTSSSLSPAAVTVFILIFMATKWRMVLI
ncbi:kinesin-related protein 11 [Dorcoceras hygrometricum]|uniref:Kinesin-related protein 11 n=1 Tax=Dorcoceras hygrometricum TaxID=472368 RepID=A0A2Z7BEM9_9LAMI|nr:kinesin-related protein 11 [Dorcoceras hygrometricum]